MNNYLFIAVTCHESLLTLHYIHYFRALIYFIGAICRINNNIYLGFDDKQSKYFIACSGGEEIAFVCLAVLAQLIERKLRIVVAIRLR